MSLRNLFLPDMAFTDSTTGYDDYKGIEINDKIVLIMTGSPQITDPDEVECCF